MKMLAITFIFSGFLLSTGHASSSKCSLKRVTKDGAMISCKYKKKRKKKKLDKWAYRKCNNYDKEWTFERTQYLSCNKKGKKCKTVVGKCILSM